MLLCNCNICSDHIIEDLNYENLERATSDVQNYIDNTIVVSEDNTTHESFDIAVDPSNHDVGVYLTILKEEE